MPKSIVFRISLVLFILLAVFVKFYQLGYRSFFLDELYSVSAALEQDFQLFLSEWVLYDNSPPLYYFLLRFWMSLAPSDEASVRLLSTFAVLVGSAVFVWGIRKRFNSDAWFYLLLLVGSNYAFLFFAQEARAYSFLLCFTCVQLLFFLDLLDDAKKDKSFIPFLGFSFFTILSAYSHYSGALMGLLLFIALLLKNWKEQRERNLLLFCALGCLIAGLPWLKYMLINMQVPKFKISYTAFGLIKMYLPMLGFGNSIIGKIASLMLIAILFLVLIFQRRKLFPGSSSYRLMFLLCMLCLLLVALCPFVSPMRTYRHFIVFIPLFLLFISFTLSSISIKISKTTMLMIGISLLIVQLVTHYKTSREEWRQTVEQVVKQVGEKECTVIIVGDHWLKPAKEYLLMHGELKYMKIRREKFYRYYFDRYQAAKKIHFIVQPEFAGNWEVLLQEEMSKTDQVFVLNYTGDRNYNQSEFAIPPSFKSTQTQFLAHTLFKLSK